MDLSLFENCNSDPGLASNQNTPRAIKTSPRLKAAWYGNQVGGRKRSARYSKRVSCGRRRISFAPNRLPVSASRNFSSDTKWLAVCWLIGIKPPLAAITTRFSTTPKSAMDIPKIWRFSQTNPTNRICDAKRRTTTAEMGKSLRVIGKFIARNCGKKATKTSQRCWSSGGRYSCLFQRAQANPATSPAARASKRITGS